MSLFPDEAEGPAPPQRIEVVSRPCSCGALVTDAWDASRGEAIVLDVRRDTVLIIGQRADGTPIVARPANGLPVHRCGGAT